MPSAYSQLTMAAGAIALLLALLPCVLAQDSVPSSWSVSDNFGYPDPLSAMQKWEFGDHNFEINNNQMYATCGTTRQHTPRDAPYITEGSVSIVLSVPRENCTSPLGIDKYRHVGVGLRDSAGNVWRMGMCQRPVSHASPLNYWEFNLNYGGVSQSQTVSGRTLPGAYKTYPAQTPPAWRFDEKYRITVTFSSAAKEVHAFMYNVTGGINKQIGHYGYSFNVTSHPYYLLFGQPMIAVEWSTGYFADFQAAATQVLRPGLTDPVYEPYSPPKPINTVPLSFQATGYFRTATNGNTHWLVDPQGKPFFAAGIQQVLFHGHQCQKTECRYKEPYYEVVKTKYNANESYWSEVQANRMWSWNINSMALVNELRPNTVSRASKLPYALSLQFGGGFAMYDGIVPHITTAGLPNVFSPYWEVWCDAIARPMARRLATDPTLIGYTLDNELEWYGPFADDPQPWGLFRTAFRFPADSTVKQGLMRYLNDSTQVLRPSSLVQDFNTLFNTSFKSYGDLERSTMLLNISDTDPLIKRQFAEKFTAVVGRLYFDTITRAIRRYDQNHMILGVRLAGSAPAALWPVIGQYSDVLTCNYYPYTDFRMNGNGHVRDRLTDYFMKAGGKRPLMITEWSHPGLDTLCPSSDGAGMRVDTQTQRAMAYHSLTRAFASLDFVVGYYYFMWQDQPIEGMSYAWKENSNYGLINQTNDDVYPEITEAATLANARVAGIHHGDKTHAFDVPDPVSSLRAGLRPEQSFPPRNAVNRPILFTSRGVIFNQTSTSRIIDLTLPSGETVGWLNLAMLFTGGLWSGFTSGWNNSYVQSENGTTIYSVASLQFSDINIEVSVSCHVPPDGQCLAGGDRPGASCTTPWMGCHVYRIANKHKSNTRVFERLCPNFGPALTAPNQPRNPANIYPLARLFADTNFYMRKPMAWFNAVSQLGVMTTFPPSEQDMFVTLYKKDGETKSESCFYPEKTEFKPGDSWTDPRARHVFFVVPFRMQSGVREIDHMRIEDEVFDEAFPLSAIKQMYMPVRTPDIGSSSSTLGSSGVSSASASNSPASPSSTSSDSHHSPSRSASSSSSSYLSTTSHMSSSANANVFNSSTAGAAQKKSEGSSFPVVPVVAGAAVVAVALAAVAVILVRMRKGKQLQTQQQHLTNATSSIEI